MICLTYEIFGSICNVSLQTYKGASVTIRSIFDCILCIKAILELFAQPQGSLPSTQIGSMMEFSRKILYFLVLTLIFFILHNSCLEFLIKVFQLSNYLRLPYHSAVYVESYIFYITWLWYLDLVDLDLERLCFLESEVYLYQLSLFASLAKFVLKDGVEGWRILLLWYHVLPGWLCRRSKCLWQSIYSLGDLKCREHILAILAQSLARHEIWLNGYWI